MITELKDQNEYEESMNSINDRKQRIQNPMNYGNNQNKSKSMNFNG